MPAHGQPNRLPEEWPTFSESFYSTTNEFMYSDLHNIMRLRDTLKGKARETVEPLLGSSANMEDIMSNLKDTFGRPEQLIKTQIQKVRKIPPLAKDDLNALVNFAIKASNMATFLKNAGGEHHVHNPSLLSELVAKLPINRQMEWGEKCISLNETPSILGFSCLKKDHQLNQCRNKVRCSKNNCQKFHNVLLHYEIGPNEENENAGGTVQQQPEQRNCHVMTGQM
ncbi:uncharacterized protein isoform X2 [Musca autumnalis]|uniref:uncharacterized protein isoform X2 n=1 Tax=Musca autumnalis TaxID=221902 RepID=UPI003CF6A1A4